MQKQITVFGYVREPRRSTKVASFPEGVSVELKSADGRNWFFREDSMIAQMDKKAEIAYLTESQKRWLEMVELPWSGMDVKSALRMGYRTDGGGM